MAAHQQFTAFLSSKEDTTGQFIVLSDSESAGGGFMTNYYIHKAVRAGHRTCIISLLHTFDHYSSICNKLGVNLSKALNEKSMMFIDCLSGTIATDRTSKETAEKNKILQSPYNSRDLCSVIFGAIEELHGGGRCGLPTCVIMDDTNTLLSLGWSVGDVVKLVTSIYNYVTEITNSEGYIVITSHDIGESGDDEIDRADNLLHLHLLHCSTLTLKMSGLATGYSKDVHGEVTRHSHDPLGSFPSQYKTRSHSSQFRILDRGIRLFAKGTSEAVL